MVSVHKFLIGIYSGILISGNLVIIATDVTIEFTCNGSNDLFPPTWLVNGTAVGTVGHDGYSSVISGRESTLTIDGHPTCDSLSLVCKILTEAILVTMHNITLIIQG